MHQITEESRAVQCDIQEQCRKFSFMYRLSVNHVLGQLRDLVEHLPVYIPIYSILRSVVYHPTNVIYQSHY